MIHRNVPIGLTCLSRVDRLTPELVALMKHTEYIRVCLGLESGSNETLMLMNKRVTVEQGIRAVHLFSRAAICSAGFFMVGYPKETVESIEKTFALVPSLPLDGFKPGKIRMLPSEFDEHRLGRWINETMEAFRNKKCGTSSGKNLGT